MNDFRMGGERPEMTPEQEEHQRKMQIRLRKIRFYEYLTIGVLFIIVGIVATVRQPDPKGGIVLIVAGAIVLALTLLIHFRREKTRKEEAEREARGEGPRYDTRGRTIQGAARGRSIVEITRSMQPVEEDEADTGEDE